MCGCQNPGQSSFGVIKEKKGTEFAIRDKSQNRENELSVFRHFKEERFCQQEV
jgi:hypothetical protein